MNSPPRPRTSTMAASPSEPSATTSTACGLITSRKNAGNNSPKVSRPGPWKLEPSPTWRTKSASISEPPNSPEPRL